MDGNHTSHPKRRAADPLAKLEKGGGAVWVHRRARAANLELKYARKQGADAVLEGTIHPEALVPGGAVDAADAVRLSESRDRRPQVDRLETRSLRKHQAHLGPSLGSGSLGGPKDGRPVHRGAGTAARNRADPISAGLPSPWTGGCWVRPGRLRLLGALGPHWDPHRRARDGCQGRGPTADRNSHLRRGRRLQPRVCGLRRSSPRASWPWCRPPAPRQRIRRCCFNLLVPGLISFATWLLLPVIGLRDGDQLLGISIVIFVAIAILPLPFIFLAICRRSRRKD